jgi:hypothetical protein
VVEITQARFARGARVGAGPALKAGQFVGGIVAAQIFLGDGLNELPDSRDGHIVVAGRAARAITNFGRLDGHAVHRANISVAVVSDEVAVFVEGHAGLEVAVAIHLVGRESGHVHPHGVGVAHRPLEHVKGRVGGRALLGLVAAHRHGSQ